MFKIGEIWAYPTDTSFGLGARADDFETLENLKKIKNRSDEKFFSLMVRDIEMLKKFAKVPKNLDGTLFLKKPLTVLLNPRKKLPIFKFWPKEKVAFRVATIPEISKFIEFPITATSANISDEKPIFTVLELKKNFNDKINIYEKILELPVRPPSEIWDYTQKTPQRIR